MTALRIVATVLWTVVRICLTLVMAIVLGGFRGASRVKMSSAATK